MLIRIVKLNFKEEHVDSFKSIFETTKTKIIAFEGCSFLELYQDKSNKNIFFTYSYWDSENHLNAYRHSDFFKTVWSNTKALFDAKPEAWSVDRLATLEKNTTNTNIK